MTPDPTSLLVELRAGAPTRERAVAVLRAGLDAGRARARQRLEAGAGGVEVARLYAEAADAVMKALWEYASTDVYPPTNPTDTDRLAVLAVGGYGRGVLAPFSDLDLMFLRPWKVTARAETLTEFMLYVLWDLGLKVGWAARSVDEALKLARADMMIRTTLLEARPLAGDPALAEAFLAKFQKEAARADARPFIAAKLTERDVRHEKAGASRYRVEPNVKEGKGGLRDLNTLFWIARSLAPESILGRRALEGLLTPKEQRGVEQAFDFLWSVRIWLHLTAGRAEEKLTFDVQAEIARRMGFKEEAGEAAVERFMRRYFLTARDVGGLTRAFCAKLEADRNKAPPGIAGWFAKKVKRTPLDVPGFVEEGGRLVVEDPAIFDRDPVNLIRLFRTVDRHRLDLHPDTFTAVTRRLNLVTPKLRRDPEATRAFLDLLVDGSQPYRVLSLMNETGLMGRFLPEFGRVVGQTQLNMYHAYTVDEHTLRAIGIINDIQRGKHEEDHPLSTAILPRIADREALFLAMLLHDTGKGGTRGQEDDGSIAASRACERLGLPKAQTELVAWLVRHHLVLSDYAQKRDVSDPETVAAFARIVENPERLRLLLVLTVADIRAVGPGVWNGWKGQLMRELYAATEAAFRGGRGSDLATAFRKQQSADAETARAALIGADPEAAGWAVAMEDAYFTAFGVEDQRAHAALARRMAERGGAAAQARFRAEHNAAELTVAAPDRPGLFADLARALAAMGADVVGARVFTSAGGQALDVFYLQDAAGEPFGRRHRAVLDRACRAIEAAARGEPAAGERTPGGLQRRATAFEITPTVIVDNGSSSGASIVEVSGRDRPGLLADLAGALSAAGLSIRSAHIDSFGERAVDAFYVRDEKTGRRLEEGKRLDALREALTAVLAAPEAEGRTKPKLARAKAGAGR